MAIQKNTTRLLKKLNLPFSAVIHKTLDLIKDPGTLAIYVYLSTKPEDWVIQETELMRRFGKGRDFIHARLKDLREIGLLVTKPTRNEKGHITGWKTMLYSHLGAVDTPDTPEPEKKEKQKPKSSKLEAPKVKPSNTDKPDSGFNQNTDFPEHTNNRLSLVKKETTTTKENDVVVSESIDEELIELRNKYMPNDERDSQEFVKQCKWHLEHGDRNKYTFSQRLAGIKKLIRNKTFETPATYPKQKAVNGVADWFRYNTYLNGIKNDIKIKILPPETEPMPFEEWSKLG